ncbi:hypothetical protein ACOSQ3_008261 [Xanthoceras sorbifolium]
MARLVRSAQRTLVSSACLYKTQQFQGLRSHNSSPFIPSPRVVSSTSNYPFQLRRYATSRDLDRNHDFITESPPEDDILRILNSRISHQSHPYSYRSRILCKETFESFTVEYRPRERLVVLNKKLEDSGHIMKTEASLVSDGFLSPGEFKFVDGQIYDFDMIVYISEEEGSSDVLKFVCSVWAMRPYTLKIHRVYVLSRDNILVSPYKGPRIRDVSLDLETTLKEFLKARQINDKLYSFLNQTLMEKENIRRENWFRTLHSCLAKKH